MGSGISDIRDSVATVAREGKVPVHRARRSPSSLSGTVELLMMSVGCSNVATGPRILFLIIFLFKSRGALTFAAQAKRYWLRAACSSGWIPKSACQSCSAGRLLTNSPMAWGRVANHASHGLLSS